MNSIHTAPETKSAGADHAALADSFDEFMSAFEAFREENDRRLSQIETRKSVIANPRVICCFEKR